MQPRGRLCKEVVEQGEESQGAPRGHAAQVKAKLPTSCTTPWPSPLEARRASRSGRSTCRRSPDSPESRAESSLVRWKLRIASQGTMIGSEIEMKPFNPSHRLMPNQNCFTSNAQTPCCLLRHLTPVYLTTASRRLSLAVASHPRPPHSACTARRRCRCGPLSR